MRNCRFLISGLSVCLCAALVARALPAWADDVYTVVIKKSEEKKKTRFSLSDIYEQDEKIKIMDMWLALHTPSPFEFWIGGQFTQVSAITGGSSTGWSGDFGANASLVGLEFQLENLVETHWYGTFHLRLFGFQQQGTNITLGLGLRDTEAATASFRSPYVDAAVTVYLFRFFGIDGLYRYYFASSPGTGGASFSGSRWQVGAFIDFSPLRVFGEYVSDSYGVNPAAFAANGFNLGLRFFF